MGDEGINVLLGKTLASVVADDDGERVEFKLTDGTTYVMMHHQDCCESVSLNDVAGGELSDLQGQVVLAEEVSQSSDSAGCPPAPREPGSYYDESYTWTFYRIQTIDSPLVTMRWFGTSNGYYSEDVSFSEVTH